MLSTGTVDQICQRASDALAGPHAQLHDWVLDQAAVHVDETGWRTAGDGRALWTLTTPGAALFQIAEHCNREQFQALIGPYPGIVVSDRWNGFEHLDPNRRQVCWSHIQRDFRRHSEGLAEQKTFGEQGLELTRRVFSAWRAYQHEHHNRDRLKAEIAPIQTELRRLLEDASPKSRRTRWHRRFANNLLKVWPALWTFTTIDGAAVVLLIFSSRCRSGCVWSTLPARTSGCSSWRCSGGRPSAGRCMLCCRLRDGSTAEIPARWTDLPCAQRDPSVGSLASPAALRLLAARLEGLSARRPRRRAASGENGGDDVRTARARGQRGDDRAGDGVGDAAGAGSDAGGAQARAAARRARGGRAR